MYISRYKYNNKVYNTEDELLNEVENVVPVDMYYDYEDLIKYYVYDDIVDKVDDDE